MCRPPLIRRVCSPWCAPAASAASDSSFVTVLNATPATLEIARIDMPSTSIFRICTRFAVLVLFMPHRITTDICLSTANGSISLDSLDLSRSKDVGERIPRMRTTDCRLALELTDGNRRSVVEVVHAPYVPSPVAPSAMVVAPVLLRVTLLSGQRLIVSQSTCDDPPVPKGRMSTSPVLLSLLGIGSHPNSTCHTTALYHFAP